MKDHIRISGIIEESISNGPGIRMVVFTQGCSHKCPGCHNPQTHDPEGGYDIAIEEIIRLAKENPLLDGITLSGGDPFDQAEASAALASALHHLGYHITTYTGYTYEYILMQENQSGFKTLLEHTDLLIDGPYEMAQKSGLLKFRGSHNQRVINVRRSFESEKIVLEWT